MTTTRPPSSDTFLSVASSIANSIVGDAIWHEQRCSWIGAMPEEGPAGTVAMTYQALGPDLYGGTAGVGVFLAELARAADDAGARRTALGALRHAASRMSVLAHGSQSGLYTGAPGVALALAYAARVLDAEELDAAARATAALTVTSDLRGEFDLMSGQAGSVVGLLALRALIGGDKLLANAVSYGDALIEGAEAQGGGLAWEPPTPVGSGPLAGFSHGAAGAATALLELAEVTGDERYGNTAARAFEYERTLFDPDAQNWPDLREQHQQPNAAERSFTTFWCHGAPGIALSRLRAHELGKDEVDVHEEAVTALRTTTAWLAAALRAELNFSLCHGLAGNAEIVGEGLRLLEDDAARCVADVASAGVERYYERGAPWPSGAHGGPTPALFLGDAGVARFYLRLAEPELPSLLLVRPEAFAVGA